MNLKNVSVFLSLYRSLSFFVAMGCKEFLVLMLIIIIYRYCPIEKRNEKKERKLKEEICDGEESVEK